MSTEIPTAFVKQYTRNLIELAQQKESLFRAPTRKEEFTGEQLFIDRIGTREMTEATTRHGETEYSDTPHSRRRLSVTTYRDSDLIDTPDKLKAIIDFKSPYALAQIYARRRRVDDTIIEALGGSVFSGKTGGVEIQNFAAGECRLIDSDGDVVAEGSDHSDVAETPLTIQKILTCKQLLDDANVDPDTERFFAANPYNINQFMNLTEVKSSDFNTSKVLATGRLNQFAGFTFIMSTRLPVDATDADSTNCYAFLQNSIGLSIQDEPTVRMTEMANRNYSVQVYTALTLGATRVEGAQVIEINLKTSAA